MPAKSEAIPPLRIDDARSAHIFRNAPGHLPEDTEHNRSLLESLANNPAAQLGKDKYGNGWAALMRPDGTQLWIQSRGAEIINGGINVTPRVFDPRLGLSERRHAVPKE